MVGAFVLVAYEKNEKQNLGKDSLQNFVPNPLPSSFVTLCMFSGFFLLSYV